MWLLAEVIERSIDLQADAALQQAVLSAASAV
jgi:hypothetical protein